MQMIKVGCEKKVGKQDLKWKWDLGARKTFRRCKLRLKSGAGFREKKKWIEIDHLYNLQKPRKVQFISRASLVESQGGKMSQITLANRNLIEFGFLTIFSTCKKEFYE